eukprot:300160_1
MGLKHSWKTCQYAAMLMVVLVVLNQLFLGSIRDTSIIDEPNNLTYYNTVNINHIKDSRYNPENNFDFNGLNLTTTMINTETNKIITCNPNKYNYIKLLLSDLHQWNRKDNNTMITSQQIDKFFVKKDIIKWYWLRRARIQIINGNIYTNNIDIGNDDEESYRTGAILYLKHMLKAYRNYIPNTDFLWHYHDKKGSMKNLAEYDWRNIHRVPIFVSDFNEASLPHTRTLFFMPRGYLKYKYFADIAERQGGEGQSSLYNDKNIRRIKDYLEYIEIEKNNPKLLKWENKKINKAVFRGYLHNGFSRRHFFQVLNLSDIASVASEYFDAKFTTEWANTAQQHKKDNYSNRDRFHVNKASEFNLLQGNELNVKEQFEYRYQINIDGYGVRDNLMYQLMSGSIILKQLSSLIEFWYYDLVDGKDVIFWENILDLINIVIKLVDSIDVKHRMKSGSLTGFHSWILNNWDYMIQNDMTKYNYKKLKEITENAKAFVKDYLGADNMDCFFIHMLEIYNHYFFDVKSLPNEPHDRLKKIK